MPTGYLTTPERLPEILASRARRNEVGCLVWTGAKCRDGYGAIRIQSRTYGVHRVVYEMEHGPIPEGMTVDHACHTRDSECRPGDGCPHRACLDVDHLELVSFAENIRRRAMRKSDSCRHGTPWTAVPCGACANENAKRVARKRAA